MEFLDLADDRGVFGAGGFENKIGVINARDIAVGGDDCIFELLPSGFRTVMPDRCSYIRK
jgi:hypothetical protein